MSTHASTSFDLSRFCEALENRDPQTQAGMYASDATVTIADQTTPPGSPRVIIGRDAIGAWIEDVSRRDMTHAVQRSVQDEHGAALTEACRYPDGTNVLCATVFSLSDGLITDQTVVQTWDQG